MEVLAPSKTSTRWLFIAPLWLAPLARMVLAGKPEHQTLNLTPDNHTGPDNLQSNANNLTGELL
jgi:hypothetical protein